MLVVGGLMQGAHDDALQTFDMQQLVKLTMNELPATCPFGLDQILAFDWWPDPRGED